MARERLEKPERRRRKRLTPSRFAFFAALVFSGLYLILHLVLASQPVQKRVLEEVQKALAGSGLELTIESLEFAAFSPKIYLNRVSIKTLPSAPVQFPNPLAIDKIKIEFQPLALISGKVVIEDAALYQPRIVLPSADQLYRRVDKLVKSRKRVELEGGYFKVVVKKFGVVDALIDISSQNPSFQVRSRSLSLSLENNLGGQQTITASSSKVEIRRGPLHLNLTGLDLDLDTTAKSLRVNRGLIEGDGIYLNFKGSSSIPQGKESWPSLVNLSYDVRVPLAVLNQIPELSAPPLEGVIRSKGNIRAVNGNFDGSGAADYEQVSVDGYRVGQGRLNYVLSETKLALRDLRLHYGDGDISSKEVTIDLKGSYPLKGDLQISNIKLESVLAAIKVEKVPLHLAITGPVSVSGSLKSPFEINLDMKAAFNDFKVFKPERRKPAAEEVLTLDIPKSEAAGRLTFNLEKFLFQTKIMTLGGTLDANGYVSYDNQSKVKVKGEGVSLTGLSHIAELAVGGRANLLAEIDVQGKDARIGGSFEVTEGEVANILLGPVKGQAYYHEKLLSFENLELSTTLEPVKGNGFVDFVPEKTHYKFNVEGKRLELDQAFKSFGKKKLSFAPPKGGEVGARLLVEGGHDNEGVEVIASGQAKGFKWYGEDWNSGAFSIGFRQTATELSRLLLMKKNGGVELKGVIAENDSKLNIESHGLRVEELQWVGKAPITGRVVGQLKIEGDLSQPEGSGELRLVNTSFRGKGLPDSVVRVRTESGKIELLGRFFGEKLRGRLARPVKSKTNWDLLFYFENFDFTPLVTSAIGQDIPSVTEISATGELALSGDLASWKTFRGSGSVSLLELGLRGTPMRNKTPIKVKVEQGAIQLDRLILSGKDSQLSLELSLVPGQQIRADVDGKIDLEFLQPFIPGLEFGAGRVAAGLRFSGAPEKFQLLGNVALQDAAFRISGFQDDFRNAQVQLSVSQDKLNIDRFQATVNGGLVEAGGDIVIDRFTKFIPNLHFNANRVTMKTSDYLTTRLSGEFSIKGDSKPYLLAGKCRVHEASLTQFQTGSSRRDDVPRLIRFNINCEARNRLFVRTDVMNAEFKGALNIVGDNRHVGLLGNAESLQGYLFFRERRFNLTSANVKFESPEEILPRFTVAGRAMVREGRATQTTGQLSPSQEYEVNLQVYGVPQNYKIRLTSSPELAEPEIISLLLMGVTTRQADGSPVDLGTAIVGQIPLQSKIESQLGLDIRINTQTSKANSTPSQTTSTTAQSSTTTSDITVPSVQIQKDISEKTRVSYSNTLENVPVREFKIEHMLDDNLTVNGVAVDRSRVGTETQATQSYGLDFRYRFQFE